MDESTPGYRWEFLKSRQHAWLGLLTLGTGFLLGADRPLFLLFGAAAYALGWIYMPDMPFFRRSVDRRREEARIAESSRKLAEFKNRRDALLASLSSGQRTRYQEAAAVCREIETASADGPLARAESTDPRLHKLDELMWTFLRLLAIEETLERFLETERREDLPALLTGARNEIDALETRVKSLAGAREAPLLDNTRRLLESRLEARAVLEKRRERVEQARANLDLIRSEQERLDHQIKLLRADAVAAKNTGSISARIDATVEHLDQTNRWIEEINQFQDLVGDLPTTEGRVGYEARKIPPVIPSEQPSATRRGVRQQ